MAPVLWRALRSKRSILACGWTIVNILAFTGFLTALVITITTRNMLYGVYNVDQNDKNNKNNDDQSDVSFAITSRAIAFVAMWTSLLAAILGVFGTVILGFQSLSGRYYWCCPSSVHKTTSLVLGSFIGALLMFANLTLVCSVLFGEFQVREWNQRDQNNPGGEDAEIVQDVLTSKSSLVFSIVCMFLTILYAGFALLVYTYSDDVLVENEADLRDEALMTTDEESGYIGDRFNIPLTSRSHIPSSSDLT